MKPWLSLFLSVLGNNETLIITWSVVLQGRWSFFWVDFDITFLPFFFRYFVSDLFIRVFVSSLRFWFLFKLSDFYSFLFHFKFSFSYQFLQVQDHFRWNWSSCWVYVIVVIIPITFRHSYLYHFDYETFQTSLFSFGINFTNLGIGICRFGPPLIEFLFLFDLDKHWYFTRFKNSLALSQLFHWCSIFLLSDLKGLKRGFLLISILLFFCEH